MPPAPAPCLPPALADLLPGRLAALLPLAYRFADPSPDPARHRAALRDLAKPLGVSRERARQLLARARAILAAPDALSAAAPLRASAAALLDAHGSSLAPDALAALPFPAPPVPLFLLLADVAPAAPPYFCRGFFTTLPPADVALAADAFSALLDALAIAPSPLRSLEFLAKRLPPALPVPTAARLPLLRALALADPSALLTRDARCGPASRAAPAILRAILAKHPDSTPKFLLERFNSSVLPSSQIGAGRLRALLLADPAVRRVSPSHYSLLPAPLTPDS